MQPGTFTNPEKSSIINLVLLVFAVCNWNTATELEKFRFLTETDYRSSLQEKQETARLSFQEKVSFVQLVYRIFLIDFITEKIPSLGLAGSRPIYG